MSSLSKQITETGTRYFVKLSPGENEQRPKIHLGTCTPKQARDAKGYIEDLIHCKNGGKMQVATAEWIKDITDGLRGRLEKLGLVETRAKSRWTVAAWIADYITKRPDVKAGTKRKWQDVESKLTAFFRTDTVEGVTVQHAKNFRTYLQTTAGLSENTLRRHIGIARQFFNAAVDAEIITKNPFRGQRVSVQANDSRFFYVSPETAQAVLQACPDSEWRLVFGLARYGGLRCPSEVLGLKWQDVDFDRQRFTVHAVKTEHHADGGIRVVPMFPELKPLFQDAFDNAREGAVYCIERYRSKEVNLRTQLGRIIKKAGLVKWDKLFQNCRSTRETELFKMTGGNIKAVCSWLGNSPAVALTHYAQITDADMKEAAKKFILNDAEQVVQNQVQPASKSSEIERNEQKDEMAISGCNGVNNSENAEFQDSNSGRYRTRTYDLTGVIRAL